MSALAVLAWAGRFLFLALLCYFLFGMYRALVDAHLPGAPAARPRPGFGGTGVSGADPAGRGAACVVLASSPPGAPVLVEEPDGKERRLGEGAAVPVGESLSVGRGKGNRIRVLEPHISARHFVIRRGAGGYALEDLGTTNGTRVNGVTVRGAVRLTKGSDIEIGTVHFRFEVT